MTTVLESVYSPRHKFKDSAGGGSSSFQEERGKLFVSWIGSGKQILDIGCRDGRIARYLIEAGNEVTGFDIDSAALAKCPTGMKTGQHDLNSDWHVGHEGQFDIVVATEVVEHLYYPDRAMIKISSVLKTGGLFIGSVPNAFNLKNRFRLLFANVKDTPLGEPTHINHFSYQSLRMLLSDHFKNVSIGGIVQPRWRFVADRWPGLGSFLLTFKARKK